MMQIARPPKVNTQVNFENFTQTSNVFVPQSPAYLPQPEQHIVYKDQTPKFAHNNQMNQMELAKKSSFNSSMNSNDLSALPTFYPSTNMQMVQAQDMQSQQQSYQFNMPSPQLVNNHHGAAVGNLRKQSNYGGVMTPQNLNHQMPFVGQQTNGTDNMYFTQKQMPNPFAAQNQVQMGQNYSAHDQLRRTDCKPMNFEKYTDMPLKKKPSFSKQPSLNQNQTGKNFMVSSAPPKLMGKTINEPLPMLDLNVAAKKQQVAVDACTPNTRSTTNSSQGSYVNSDEEEISFDTTIVESPCKRMVNRQPSFIQPNTPQSKRNGAKQENSWKRKVKTELCRFWLKGLQCENQHKEQGCGFAHGQEELQKKKTLSRQYLTSVCKNFLEHPSKCTYGNRCIFQHPTHDVRERQSYTTMMEDNQRYTAMRLFQEIEGADVFYINTYAASTPRLPVFKGICTNAKDLGEDEVQKEDWAELSKIQIPNAKEILSLNQSSVSKAE